MDGTGVNGRHLDLVTTSVEDTRRIGAAIGTVVAAGDVVLVIGELGAGKTAFVQGLARGLGVAEPVTSPTFTLVAEHDGTDLRLLHADVYRLDTLDEILDLGLDQLVDDRGSVLAVEWGERARVALPGDRMEVSIEVDTADEHRLFRVSLLGHSWTDRAATLAMALHAATTDAAHAAHTAHTATGPVPAVQPASRPTAQP